MKKRSLPATTGSSVADEVGGSNKRNNRSSSPSPCEYAGYSFQRDQEVAIGVETIDASSIDPPIFFDKFISKRKPCILQSNNKTLTTTNNAAKDWNRMFHLSPQDLVDAAGQEVGYLLFASEHEPKLSKIIQVELMIVISSSFLLRAFSSSKWKRDSLPTNPLVRIEQNRDRFK
jgi:hypothetical protein